VKRGRPGRSRPIAAALLAAAVASGGAGRAADLTLPERRVFPPTSGGSPSTLERPLAELWPEGRRPGAAALSIAIYKARRRLDLLVNGRVVKSYIVNLGLAPAGDKERQGDYRTPEGDLFVCGKNARSQFTRFLALAYPSPEHARRAVASGHAGPSLARAVGEAYRRRDRCPPQGTGLGGAVGIHGSGAWTRGPGGYRVVDWTWGCVGLRDADILELFAVVRVGTPVRILPG
jgi:hypothetical protein